MAPGMNFGFGFGLSSRSLGGALTLLDQMNQYAAAGKFVSWGHFGDVTALWDATASLANIGHNGTLGLALGREQMGEYGTAYEYIQSLTVDIETGTWTHSGWDTAANDGSGGFDATKSTAGGIDKSYSDDTVAGDTGDVFFASVGVDLNTVGTTSLLLSSATNARSLPANITTTGTLEGVLQANSSPGSYSISLLTTLTGSLSVTGASLVKVPGNHWSQATAANRPLYNRVPRDDAITDGIELISNGDFSAWTGDNPDNFTIIGTEDAGSYVTEHAEGARLVSDGDSIGVRQGALDDGNWYKITTTVERNSGTLGYGLYDNTGGSGSGTSASITESGTFEQIVYCSGFGNEYPTIKRLSACDFIIKSFSVQKIDNAVLVNPYTYLSYDGSNDLLVSPIVRGANSSVYIAIRTEAALGIAVSNQPGSSTNHLISWGDGNGLSPFGPGAGTPTIHVFDADTQTWSAAIATRDALHDAITNGEWHVVEARDADMSAWTDTRINGYPSFLWLGDAGDYIEVLTSNRTDEMAVNIANYLLEQQGAL